ncbi:MAG: hypothetical protein M1831_000619 [Alyxoria varia]|nr:MAG: hypothetical protein M1831_000619 [Alyxoria varia]
MALERLQVLIHDFNGQHIGAKRGGSGNGGFPTRLHRKQYLPQNNDRGASVGNVTLIAAPGSGFTKKLFEPFHDEFVEQLDEHSVRAHAGAVSFGKNIGQEATAWVQSFATFHPRLFTALSYLKIITCDLPIPIPLSCKGQRNEVSPPAHPRSNGNKALGRVGGRSVCEPGLTKTPNVLFPDQKGWAPEASGDPQRRKWRVGTVKEYVDISSAAVI